MVCFFQNTTEIPRGCELLPACGFKDLAHILACMERNKTKSSWFLYDFLSCKQPIYKGWARKIHLNPANLSLMQTFALAHCARSWWNGLQIHVQHCASGIVPSAQNLWIAALRSQAAERDWFAFPPTHSGRACLPQTCRITWARYPNSTLSKFQQANRQFTLTNVEKQNWAPGCQFLPIAYWEQ